MIGWCSFCPDIHFLLESCRREKETCLDINNTEIRFSFCAPHEITKNKKRKNEVKEYCNLIVSGL